MSLQHQYYLLFLIHKVPSIYICFFPQLFGISEAHGTVAEFTGDSVNYLRLKKLVNPGVSPNLKVYVCVCV